MCDIKQYVREKPASEASAVRVVHDLATVIATEQRESRQGE